MGEGQILLFPSPVSREPGDAAERRAALDPERSVLVQAPAGAGKTNLLTERFLTLLARVEEPEQILAITFTRAATAEMRARILGALEAAARGELPESPAEAALRHGQAMGWELLAQPHRLAVETIDRVCLRLAHGQPMLARLGGGLAPTEDAGELYRRAARQTLEQLGGGETAEALGLLLLRRDNNLGEVETLLAGMLARRDAWLGALPLRFDADSRSEVDWGAVRARLEEPFERENLFVLNSLREIFQASDELLKELLALGRYAGAQALRDCVGCPEEVDEWLAVAELLLTKDGSWRRQWTVREGFPPGETKAEKKLARTFKQRMKDCGAKCSDQASLLALLRRLRELPPLRYSEEQWETLLAVLRVLRRAAAELRLVFAEANAVDFVEIAQAAEAVLRDEASLRGLVESERKQHLLIDEFQDTSRTQYRLVAQLLKEWQTGDGRTAFVVGDPLQSIYGFRQAEVALFHETRERGLPCGEDRRHACHPLRLRHNFRSHGELVGALNGRFAGIFAGGEDEFVAAEAERQAQEELSFRVHPVFVPDGEEDGDAEGEEAARVVEVLRGELERIAAAEARGQGEYRVAVLVRSRSHLREILPALREAGIRYRAVELEPLAERPEIADVYALTRALLHPGDRVAWLTVLRAPWCGLAVGDLHVLAGTDAREFGLVVEAIGARMGLLSAEGRARVERVWGVLEAAGRTRYVETHLAAWVERAWMGLGGPACVDRTARENVEAFFRLLDGVAPSGVEVLGEVFRGRLEKLSAAPDAGVSERFGVQVMTIHKAKGLGFEVVLVPGLDRLPRGVDRELVAVLERGEGSDSELLAAPIGTREEDDGLYTWVQAQKKAREAAERKRLFYVACTRARTRLHLFGTVRVKEGQVRRPGVGSLLEAAWAGLEGDFVEALGVSGETGLRLAAAAEVPLGEAGTAGLRRLPAGWEARVGGVDLRRRAGAGRTALFGRAEGSAAARARGRALHAVLEELGRGASGGRERLVRVAERELARSGARGVAEELVKVALLAAQSAAGRWVFAPHAGAAVESAYQMWDGDGNLRTLRVDRTFLAGEAVGSVGETHRWVVDYKTGAAGASVTEGWRAGQKALYGGQMAAYAGVLGEGLPVRLGLFYPELGELIAWDA